MEAHGERNLFLFEWKENKSKFIEAEYRKADIDWIVSKILVNDFYWNLFLTYEDVEKFISL